MSNTNTTILTGNLTTAPELRYTPSQTGVCELRLASTRGYKDSNGARQERTVFVDVQVWGPQAEPCTVYLNKGSKVCVTGRLSMDEWEDKTTGAKRSKLYIRAENVEFLSSPPKQNEEGPMHKDPGPLPAHSPF